MKRQMMVLAVAGALTAGCASNPDLERAKERYEAREYREEVKDQQDKKDTEEMNSLIDKMPDWATEKPVATGGGAYAVGSATSEKPTWAIRKAKLQAEYALAQQIRQEISGEERSQQRDGSRDTEEYQLLVDRFVEAVPLSGHEIEEQEVFSHDGEANAYVLAYISGEQLAQVAQDSRDTFVDETSSEAFDRLEKRLEGDKEGDKETSEQ